MKYTDNISRFFTVVVGISFALLALAVPAGYFFVSYMNVSGNLKAAAWDHSRYISRIASENPTGWGHNRALLDGYLSDEGFDEGLEERRVFDIDGVLIAECGCCEKKELRIEPPFVKSSAVILSSGKPVGRIEVSRSIRPLITRTLLIGLVVLPFSVGAFYFVYLVPIRTLLRAEASLRENENKYRRLFQNTNDAIYLWRLGDNGFPESLIDANDVAREMLGYSKEELFSLGVLDLIAPDYHSRLDAACGMVKDRGRHTFEMVHRAKDGRRIPVEVSVHAFPLEEAPVALVVVRDITHRKAAEEALVRSREELEILVRDRTSELAQRESELRMLFDSANDAIFLIDTKGVFIDVNRTSYERLGYTKDELLAMSIPELDSPEFAPQVPARLEMISRHGRAVFESAHKRKDGTYMPVEVNGRLIEFRGEMIFFSVVRDITDRKQSEAKIRTALKEREILLKEIHHRVKNNLQIVSGMLRLQSVFIDDPKTKAAFEESCNRIESMSLIHEKFYGSSDLSEIDFRAYVEDLIESLRSIIGGDSDRIRLQADMEGVFLDVNTAIPCGLIINELVTNAVKHAYEPDGGGVITVGMTCGPHDVCSLRVSDDGRGFPEDIDYKNASSLGLQLVASLAAQLDGTLELSRDGGTTFTVEFRL